MCRILYTQGTKIFQRLNCNSGGSVGLDAVDLALMGYDALVSLAVYLIPNMNPVVVLLADFS